MTLVKLGEDRIVFVYDPTTPQAGCLRDLPDDPGARLLIPESYPEQDGERYNGLLTGLTEKLKHSVSFIKIVFHDLNTIATVLLENTDTATMRRTADLGRKRIIDAREKQF